MDFSKERLEWRKLRTEAGATTYAGHRYINLIEASRALETASLPDQITHLKKSMTRWKIELATQ